MKLCSGGTMMRLKWLSKIKLWLLGSIKGIIFLIIKCAQAKGFLMAEKLDNNKSPFTKGFHPKKTWFKFRDLWEVNIRINQLPWLPPVQTNFNFSRNYRIKPRIALHQMIKMVCKLEHGPGIPHEPKLNNVEVVRCIRITLFSGYWVGYIELHRALFLTKHHAPGKIMTFFVPCRPTRIC